MRVLGCRAKKNVNEKPHRRNPSVSLSLFQNCSILWEKEKEASGEASGLIHNNPKPITPPFD